MGIVDKLGGCPMRRSIPGVSPGYPRGSPDAPDRGDWPSARVRGVVKKRHSMIRARMGCVTSCDKKKNKDSLSLIKPTPKGATRGVCSIGAIGGISEVSRGYPGDISELIGYGANRGKCSPFPLIPIPFPPYSPTSLGIFSIFIKSIGGFSRYLVTIVSIFCYNSP